MLRKLTGGSRMVPKTKTFIKEAHLNVSVQAQRILSNTNFSMKDLVDWIISQGIGIGGNDVAFFLEAMAKPEEEKK